MTSKEYKDKVNEIVTNMYNEFKDNLENVREEVKGTGIIDKSKYTEKIPTCLPECLKDSFIEAVMYTMHEENVFESMLRGDYKRKTTFSAIFANCEWHYADNGLSKLKNYLTDILVEHRDDIEAFAELIILSNMKAWEHADRKNENWARLYSKLYHSTRNLYAEWFDDKPNYVEALQYYMKYVD